MTKPKTNIIIMVRFSKTKPINECKDAVGFFCQRWANYIATQYPAIHDETVSTWTPIAHTNDYYRFRLSFALPFFPITLIAPMFFQFHSSQVELFTFIIEKIVFDNGELHGS